MATKAECRKCVYEKDCPILYTINAEHIKAAETLRKLCNSYKDKKCQKK